MNIFVPSLLNVIPLGFISSPRTKFEDPVTFEIIGGLGLSTPNSKSAFVVVVVIKLPVNSKSCVLKLGTLRSVVIIVPPTKLFTLTVFKSILPFTIASLSTCKFSWNITFPVPVALNSKSAFVTFDSITLPVILTLSLMLMPWIVRSRSTTKCPALVSSIVTSVNV